MKSAIAITYELDDISKAVTELTERIREKLTLEKNSVAILYGQPETDLGGLSSALSKELGCHVIGGTTAAGAVLTNEGYHELAVALHVITDNDNLFTTAISGSLADSPEKKIMDTYHKAYRDLKEKDKNAEPEMVVCIASIVSSISSDRILEKVAALCGGLPVFGFIAADDFDFSKQQVFLNGEAGGDRIAFLLLSGDIKPLFHTINLAGKKALERRLVTKSRDNVICEIDGRPAFDYIKYFPFIDDQTENLFNYQFFVEMQSTSHHDGIPVSRALNTYDKTTGEVTCFANVPENSYIGLLYCDGNDVAATSEAGIKEFINKLDSIDNGYRYSTALIATCSLRSIFLSDMKEKEGDLVKELFPSDLAVSGLYAFGEIAPTSVCNGKAVNQFHNATFTLCAI